MRKNIKKLLTFMLAGAFCAATVGGATALVSASAAETTAKTYLLTSIFKATNDATIGATANAGATEQTAKFTFKKTDSEEELSSVEFNRDIAYKWFTAKDTPNYLNFTFGFADANFSTVSFVFETTPYQAVEGNKAVNTVKFTKVSETEVGVKVFAGEEEPVGTTSTNVTIADDMIVALGAGVNAGEFSVNVNGTNVGAFTNVGANYADNGKVDTMVMKGAPVAEAQETAILFKSLNGQSFDNVTGESSFRVADDAAPVLIVNQEVSSFLLGTAFNLDYIAVDVLKDSVTISSSERQYYQYNPADTEVKGVNVSTSTYFMDTVYYKNANGDVSATAQENYKATSVWREFGEEYVSVWFELSDDTFKEALDSTSEFKKARYELAWYVEDAVELEVGSDKRDYIVLNRNDEGPQFIGLVNNETDKKTAYTKADGTATYVYEESTLKLSVDNFQTKIEELAADVYAGSNSDLQIPSVDWLIDDNNGHRSLSFTISYKTPTSTSPTSLTNKKYNALEISTAYEGWYEFKIYATDAAGNKMKYFLDEKLVDVTDNNVWDIEEIPSFRFEVKNKGIKTASGEDGDTLDNKILDDNYTMSEVKIVGASTKKSDYKLYKLNDDVWNTNSNVAKNLSKIKYDALNTKADQLVASKIAADPTLKLVDIDYMAIYLEAFIELAKVEATGVNVEAWQNAFTEISVFDSSISEDDKEAWEASDNKFNWSNTSRRFTAAEEGLYLIIADYWDADLAVLDRVPAYQLIEVQEEEDKIKGVSEWLQNNLVSLILFGVAGVFGIAIIVLLLVKPSEETLEDVDKKLNKTQKKE